MAYQGISSRASVMHIHFWNDARKPDGSVNKVLREFARLDSPKVSLTIASPGHEPPEKIEQATYLSFHENKIINRVLNKWFRFGAFTYPSLIKLIQQEKPEILHFHNRQELVDTIVKRLTYRPPVLVHYHRKFNPYTIPSTANYLVAVSGALKEDIIESTHTDIPVRVIYNPIPRLPVRPNKPRINIHTKPRLLYGGGRQTQKGFQELELALQSSELAQTFEITFCGPLFDKYTPPFEARVLGLLSEPDFMEELISTDIVVTPSHYEGFGLLALEALALEKVLVTTQAGGLREIATPKNAIIHETGNLSSLVKALGIAKDLFSSPNHLTLMDLQASAIKSTAKFCTKEITKDLAEFYGLVLINRT